MKTLTKTIRNTPRRFPDHSGKAERPRMLFAGYPSRTVGLSADAGLTLLEIMIAAGIFVMAMTFIFGSLVSVSSTTKMTEGEVIAQSQISTILEEIRYSSFQDLLEYVPPTLQGLGATQSFEVVCLDGDGEEVTLPLAEEETGDNLPNPLEVRVSTTFLDQSGRPVTVSASTLVGR